MQFARTQFKEYNTLRTQDNQKGQVQEKAVLCSIKERVWKNHKAQMNRRRRQVKEFAPPSTYEIYTMSQTSRAVRNSFSLVSPRQPKPDPNLDPSQIKPQTLYTPCNLRNPLQDYSIKQALNISETKNPFKVK